MKMECRILKKNLLRESGGWKDYADAAERKKIWAKRRKAGDIVVRATLEAEEVKP